MKIIIKNRIWFVCIMTLIFTGCADLDVLPEGEMKTEGQKQDVIKDDPSKLISDINALYAKLIEYRVTSSFDKKSKHWDFGYAAFCMITDHRGQDTFGPDAGFNWFNNWQDYTDRNSNASTATYFPWILFYSHLKISNDILRLIPSEDAKGDDTKAAYRGQALASRAFDYLNLVQIYQLTYKGHEDFPAIPIVTENKTANELSNNPRAKVQAVYDLIISDLTEAIILLDGFKREDKSIIDQNVAYGLRARANLLMQNWSAAASDADNAMKGFTPYTINEVSVPTFNSANASSWIWGNIVTTVNDIVQSGIINYPSHLCSFAGGGYTTATNTYRMINVNLWNRISDKDVRKGWWVNEKLSSPYTDGVIMKNKEGKNVTIAEYLNFSPYTNTKFGPYQNEILNSTKACDWPVMRIEEMILIKAEGLAMSGQTGQAKQVLESFLNTYRYKDGSYICPLTDAQGIQNEVWLQRRIELWGEGFSYLDLLRLKKPITRYENGITNYPEGQIYNIPAESPVLLWRIPESEINTNKGISESDNNPIASKPSAVKK